MQTDKNIKKKNLKKSQENHHEISSKNKRHDKGTTFFAKRYCVVAGRYRAIKRNKQNAKIQSEKT